MTAISPLRKYVVAGLCVAVGGLAYWRTMSSMKAEFSEKEIEEMEQRIAEKRKSAVSKQ